MEGNCPECDFIAVNLPVRGHGTEAAAAHGFQECPFGGNRVKGLAMIQPFADVFDSLVLLANFQADRALADAGQHQIQVQHGGQQPFRHSLRVCNQFAIRLDFEMETGQAGQGQDSGIELILLGDFLQPGEVG